MNTSTVNPDASNHATTDQEASRDAAAGSSAGLQAGPRPLCRPTGDRMLAGVAAGVAAYLGADVTVVRIVLAVLAVMGGAGVPIYLAGWLLIPEEGADQSIASGFIQSMQSRSR